MTDDAKLPKPTAESIAKYNEILTAHQAAKNLVLKALAAHTHDRAAEAEVGRLSKEFNALRKQYDFSPPSGPLQKYVDELTGEGESKDK